MKSHKESRLTQFLSDWPIKLLSLGIAVLLVIFHRNLALEERQFSVPLDIRIAEGFVPAGAFPRSARIIFRGSEDQIYLILDEDVDAYVDLSGVTDEGVIRAPVRIRRRGTALHAEPLEVRVEPAEVSLTVERRAVRRLSVEPLIVGYPAKGYEVASVLISPETLLVEGPRSKVMALEVLKTRPLSLEGRDKDFYYRADLALDDETLIFPEGRVSDVQIKIQETVLIRTFEDVEILALDLDAGLTLAEPPTAGTMKIQGKQIDLEKLQTGDVLMTVDFSRVRMPGTYTLPVKTDLPPSLVVLSQSPTTIEVTVEEASGGSR